MNEHSFSRFRARHLRSASIRSGFTLIELLVAISIVMMLSIVLVIQQSKFDSTVGLKNTAYEVALVIREAQTNALHGKNTSPSTDFNSPYGVYFKKDSSDFVLFRDTHPSGGSVPGDGKYNSSQDELIDTFKLSGGATIADIQEGATSGKDELHVTFTRPNPNPTFRFPGMSAAADATVVIESRDGATIPIKILQTGQISVGDIATP